MSLLAGEGITLNRGPPSDPLRLTIARTDFVRRSDHGVIIIHC